MAVENQSLVNYSLLAMALLIWYVLYLFFGYVVDLGVVQSYIGPYLGETGSKVLPFLLGLAGGGSFFGVARKKESVNKFGIEVVVELKKVVWPTRKEVTGTTTAVMIVIFIVAIILFIFDKIFGRLIAFLVS